MDQPMTKEESYAERRQLFKNIWDTALHIDDKDPEIMNKPKVIKTLRLAEVDRCILDKKKKQRIRNLRTVCKKILDFCDRQDADDLFYEQMAVEGQRPPQHKVEEKPRKKPARIKKVANKTKSLLSPHRDPAQAKATISERKDDLFTKFVSKTSPIKIRTTVVKKSTAITKGIKSKQSPRNLVRTSGTGNILGDVNVTVIRRKVSKNTGSKRKKPSESALPAGANMKYNFILSHEQHTAPNPTKKLLK